MTPQNVFSLITIIATVLCLGIGFALEGTMFLEFYMALPDTQMRKEFLMKVTTSGIWYYAYNECAYAALAQMNPLTHSVLNSLKRVFILIIAVVIFGTYITPTGILGSLMAIGGAILYSYARQRYG